MEQKNIFAKKIQKAFFRHQKLKQLHKILKGIKRIQNLWRCRMEYKNFQETRKKIKIIQTFMRKKLLQIQAKNYRQFCIKIQKYFRRYRDYKTFLNSKINIIKIQKLIRGGLARKIVKKIRMCRDIVLNCMIFPAWDTVIRTRIIKIQKIARGYITKCKHFKIVCQARRAKKNLMEIKSTRLIQKIARGYIVRQRFHRLNRAAFYIQGYFKMKWLSALVKRLRKAAKIIQRNIRIFINRRKAVRKRINSFLGNHSLEFDELKTIEKDCLFQRERKNRIDDEYHENDEAFFLNNVKEVAPYEKKIQLFTYIFDIDFMVFFERKKN